MEVGLQAESSLSRHIPQIFDPLCLLRARHSARGLEITRGRSARRLKACLAGPDLAGPFRQYSAFVRAAVTVFAVARRGRHKRKSEERSVCICHSGFEFWSINPNCTHTLPALACSPALFALSSSRLPTFILTGGGHRESLISPNGAKSSTLD